MDGVRRDCHIIPHAGLLRSDTEQGFSGQMPLHARNKKGEKDEESQKKGGDEPWPAEDHVCRLVVPDS